MKELGKKAISFFSDLGNSFFSLFLVAVYSKWFNSGKIKRNTELNKVYILANGPSLETDFQKLSLSKGADFFVVNDFCKSEFFQEIQPCLYIINDPAYWMPNQEVVEEGINAFFLIINSKVNWELNLFVPFSGYYHIQNKIRNSNIKVVPFNNTPVKGFQGIEFFLYKRNLGVPQLQNVLVGAIYMSIFLGYKKINLLGVDHDWHKRIEVDENNHVVWTNNHFYDKEEFNNKRLRIYNGNDFFDMAYIFKALSVTHQSYKKLSLYSKKNGIEVINHTKDSCIDSFKRIKDHV